MRLKLVLPIAIIAVAGIAGCSSTSSSSSSSSSPASASASASVTASPNETANGYTQQEANAYAAVMGEQFGKDSTFTEAQAQAITVCAWKGITTTIPHDDYVASTQDSTSEIAKQTTEKLKAIGTACAKDPSAY